MDIVTPFELVEWFAKGQSMAVVGNAPSLRGAGLGAWIDSHDVVVRFNECALADYADDIGRKTDILVTNPYLEARTRPLLDGGSCRLVLAITRMTRRGNRKAFEAYVGTLPVLFSYTPDINVTRTGSLTTGTYALGLLFTILRPAQLSVTGFTAFLDHTAHHYWSDATPAGAAKHDHVEDARALLSVLNRFASPTTIVTAEIAWMARRIGTALDDRIKVRKLPDSSWDATSSS